MNIIKKVLLVFFVALTFIFVLSMFLPSEYKIERSLKIKCESPVVYNYIIDINNLDSWFYISKSIDSTIIYKYRIDTLNFKSSLEWNGGLMGQGTFEYTNFRRNELIEFKLGFQDNKVIKSGKIKLIPISNGTEVRWIDYGENGWNPVNRIFGLFIDGFLGPDMEKSLKKMKSKLDC